MAKKQIARMLRAISTGLREAEQATFSNSRKPAQVIDGQGKIVDVYRYSNYSQEICIPDGTSRWGTRMYKWVSTRNYMVW